MVTSLFTLQASAFRDEHAGDPVEHWPLLVLSSHLNSTQLIACLSVNVCDSAVVEAWSTFPRNGRITWGTLHLYSLLWNASAPPLYCFIVHTSPSCYSNDTIHSLEVQTFNEVKQTLSPVFSISRASSCPIKCSLSLSLILLTRDHTLTQDGYKYWSYLHRLCTSVSVQSLCHPATTILSPPPPRLLKDKR